MNAHFDDRIFEDLDGASPADLELACTVLEAKIAEARRTNSYFGPVYRQLMGWKEQMEKVFASRGLSWPERPTGMEGGP